MSAHTADQNFAFQLPTLSYVDAKWEEPNLRAPAITLPATQSGVVSRLLAHYHAWQRTRRAMTEFAAMSDYELADIGLSRGDVYRVFDATLSEDFQQRGRTA